jgi:hypothetical protein
MLVTCKEPAEFPPDPPGQGWAIFGGEVAGPSVALKGWLVGNQLLPLPLGCCLLFASCAELSHEHLPEHQALLILGWTGAWPRAGMKLPPDCLPLSLPGAKQIQAGTARWVPF